MQKKIVSWKNMHGFVIFLFLCSVCRAFPLGEPAETVIVKGLEGKNVTLPCNSNDKNHIFYFWEIENTGKVIGPANKDDKTGKYKYVMLPGILMIQSLTLEDAGLYRCVSRGVTNENINVQTVHLEVQEAVPNTTLSPEEVWETSIEHDTTMNTYRLTIVVLVLVLVIGGVGVSYKLWHDRYRNSGYQTQEEDDDDDEDSDLYAVPGSSSRRSRSPNPVTIDHKLLGEAFENPSTDFSRIMDRVTNK